MKEYDNEQRKDKNAEASAKSSAMVLGADTRNMAWRTSNVGSKLLSKMGWSDGQAVGKRQRRTTVVTTNDSNKNDNYDIGEATTKTELNANTATSSSEGLRVMKRQDGLGIGASAASSAYSNASNAVQHVQDYVDVLALLKPKHQKDDKAEKKKKKKEKKKRKRSKEESATNTETTTTTSNDALSKKIRSSSNSTMTNPKIRKAKFQQKTNEDYKGIFGSFHSDDIINATTTTTK